MPIKYGSVCSGIEAATVAWHPLGWEPEFYSEIEKFPCGVLNNHYPKTPNHGDMTKFKEWPDAEIDLLVGGTPCQSFSIAGLRKGITDPRGNLMLTFGAIAARYRPQWLVWENVPGVLSSNEGRDFGTFLGMLGQLGYGFAYRVLDAQYFGVAQRRRRVFVIGYLGDWRPPGAVLFEPESLSGDSPPSREKRQGVAGNVAIGIDEECNARIENFGPLLRGGQGGTRQAVAFTQNDGERDSGENIAPTIRSGGDGGTPTLAVAYSIMPMNSGKDYKARETDISQPIMAGGPVGGNQGGDFITFSAKDHGADATDNLCPTLRAGGFDKSHANSGNWPAVAFNGDQSAQTRSMGESLEHTPTLRADGPVHVQRGLQIRRLTPIECERLQGFPDNYTQIPWRNKPAEQCPDGPRYKALGNSMAVPVMRWLGERIQLIDALTTKTTTKTTGVILKCQEI